MELAALAYDAEQEHVETSLEVRDAAGVRDLMLRLAKLEQAAQDVAALQEQIVDRYRQRLAGIHEEQERIRASIEAFIRHVNGGEKVSIPDAGTAYLTTKNKGGKARVVDSEAFKTWLRENDPVHIVEKAVFDPSASLNGLHEDGRFYTHPDGKLIDRETGEVIEIPGIEAQPECKSLALRKAA